MNEYKKECVDCPYRIVIIDGENVEYECNLDEKCPFEYGEFTDE